jgi:hypothetical protein
MEREIKKAIFCELRAGVLRVKDKQKKDGQVRYVFEIAKEARTNGKDQTLGFQITLTLTADEKSSLTPNVSFKEPISPATVFRQNVSQSFTLGAGGTLTSQNVRYDKYTFLFTGTQLFTDPENVCPKGGLRPTTTSSPFVDATGLGISDWLPGAVEVFKSEPHSSKTDNKLSVLAAPDQGGGGFTPNVATYDNKFVVVSSANVAATWNLVRIGTGTSPLFDLNRTRTHELLITASEDVLLDSKAGFLSVQTGPSDIAKNSHFASEIGSAVSAAIGNR